jgi:D-amino-acid dehydrogenase
MIVRFEKAFKLFNMSKTAVIGGGILGLFTAYYLRKAGHEVVVFDRGDFSEGCSHGNAGMIVPSHIIPLAAPGVIRKGLKWLFDRKSPFAIRPSWNPDLWYWLLHFQKSATDSAVQKAVPELARLSLRSRALYQAMAESRNFSLGLNSTGILMLCKEAATLHEELHVAELAKKHEIEAIPMDPGDLESLDPGTRYSVRGAVFYPGDAVINPAETMSALRKWLHQEGVKFYRDIEITDLRPNKGSIKTAIGPSGQSWSFDHWVLCGGVWTSKLLQKLKFRLPLVGGKGYSFLQTNHIGLHIPSLLLDHRVSVSPFSGLVRFGGTMELGPLRSDIRWSRVKGIFESIKHYYPEWKGKMPEKSAVWYGFRPCSPDGLPYIGTIPGVENLHVAAGHGMMGVSLAPASGEAIARLIIQNEQPAAAFHPGRFNLK